MRQAILFLCTIFTTGNSPTLFAQLPADPASVFSQDALLYLDVPDVDRQLIAAKAHWVDLYYGQAVDEGLMERLDVHPANFLFNSQAPGHIMSQFKKHWLKEFSRLLQNKESKAVTNLASLEKRDEPISDDLEFELVEEISALFNGRLVAGIEPLAKGYATVVAFDFKHPDFDWFDELTAHLPGEGNVEDGKIEYLERFRFHFFRKNGVIVVVWGDDKNSTICKSVAKRLDGRSARNLTTSSYFERVKSILERNPRDRNQVYLFVRFDEILYRTNVPGRNYKYGEYQFSEMMAKERKVSAHSMGARLEFNINECEYRFQVAFPVTKPIAESLLTRLESYDALDKFGVKTLSTAANVYVFTKPTLSSWTKPQPQRAIGNELSLGSSPFFPMPRNNHNRSGRYPNPLQHTLTEPVEQCRFSYSHYPEGIRFHELDRQSRFRKNMLSLSNGYVFDRDDFPIDLDEFDDEAGEFLNSKHVQTLVKWMIASESDTSPYYWKDGVRLSGVDPDATVNVSLKLLRYEQKDNLEIATFGMKSVVFALIAKDDNVYFLTGPQGNPDEVFDIVAERFAAKDLEFDFDVYFPDGLDGELRVLAIRQNVFGDSLVSELTAPVHQIIWASDLQYGFSQHEPSPIFFLRHLALRTLPTHFLLSTWNKDIYNQVQHPLHVCAMTVAENNDHIKYYFVVKKPGTRQ